MNNNCGWGLRSELWICLGIILFFAIAVILINRVFNNMENEGILPKNNTEEIKIIDDTKNNSMPIIENNDENLDEEKSKELINYSNLEDKLVLAGSKYASKYLVNEEFDSKIITVARLQTEELLDILEIEGIECSGYIKITKEEEFKYYPFINCGKFYQTIGYNQNFDNIN